jgi:hypothetical protein
MVYKQLKIDITRPQLQKALKGKPIQINASQIGSGSSYLSLHPANAKLVEKASMKGCGCVINLSPGELMATAEDMEGNGIFGDIWKGLKSSYRWVKKNIVDTPIYQEALKPLVRGAVETGKTVLKGYAPKLAPAIDMATDKIGSETGAFGLARPPTQSGGVKKARMSKAKKYEVLKARGLYLS